MSRVCIAQIGAAHGVRGEVRLKPFTEDPFSVTRYGALESEDGNRRFEIESVRPAKDMLVARLKGVADRNAAEALKNIRLYVAREKRNNPEKAKPKKKAQERTAAAATAAAAPAEGAAPAAAPAAPAAS